MAADPEMIIPSDVIEQQIAQAEKRKAQWIRSLTGLRELDNGRMKINGIWETTEQAAARIQELIDIHTRTIELVSAFRIEPSSE